MKEPIDPISTIDPSIHFHPGTSWGLNLTSVAREGFKIARQLLGATGFGPPVAEPQQRPQAWHSKAGALDPEKPPSLIGFLRRVTGETLRIPREYWETTGGSLKKTLIYPDALNVWIILPTFFGQKWARFVGKCREIFPSHGAFGFFIRPAISWERWHYGVWCIKKARRQSSCLWTHIQSHPVIMLMEEIPRPTTWNV